MSKNIDLEWYFPVQETGGEEEGANEPGIGLFLNDRDSLPRETGQNIGDARADDSKPAIAKFEVITLKASEIPGMESLKKSIALCREFINPADRNASQFIGTAIKASQDDTISILKISDFNTTGLGGDDLKRGSPFHRLIWTQGSANPHGAGGGTHGIGQRAPFAYSDLRTVFYSTMTESNQVAFIGKSILCGHESSLGFHRRVGYLGHKSADGKSNTTIRNKEEIPPAFLRTERGTDIIILGFNLQNWAEVFLSQILDNFFAAINKGAIEFVISEEGKVIHNINSETLPGLLELRKKDKPDTWHFYKALTSPLNGTPFVKDLGKIGDSVIGEAKLYIFRDPEANSEIARIRTPGILVYHRKNKTLRGYSAVLEVDNKEGNSFLGAIEDPSHKKWEALKHKDATKVLKELNDFIKDTLNKLAEASRKDSEDIEDLADLLPDEGEIETESKQQPKYSSPVGKGPLAGDEVVPDRNDVFVSGTVSEEDDNDLGTSPGKGKGIRKGTAKKKNKNKKTKKKTGQSSFFFRGFPASQLSTDEYKLVFWSDNSWTGKARLVATGEDGFQEDLEILTALDETTGKTTRFSGAILTDLKVKKGIEKVIKIKIKSIIPFKVSIAAVEG